ncbi:hypothetical protein TNCT_381371 [Trichonephila clavata]|uniref:Uncharacterized protein n=1 Tax=Trichonephila clavata TaxID=2740835 RepID=A0A8X6FR20_TRICU|nr:hypothetical protein TNCT_540801 [Trichonephila clavata]GFR04415.1 hypothetical protein TNCT_381371 [Trichonephila clavata]
MGMVGSPRSSVLFRYCFTSQTVPSSKMCAEMQVLTPCLEAFIMVKSIQVFLYRNIMQPFITVEERKICAAKR